MRVARIAVLALICGSCVPLPHRTFHTPVQHGRIVTGGKPAGGVPLRVVADPKTPCEGKRKLETRTDANGDFAFCPIPQIDFFLFILPAHTRFRWNTCAKVNGEWIVLHESSRYTLSEGGPREIERLDCDLDGVEGERCRRETDIDVTPEKLKAALGERRCAGVPRN